jgi:hypothetical protein
VLELAATHVAVVVCAGDMSACDAIETVAGAVPCRVAEDEVMLAGAPDAVGRLLRDATARALAADPCAVVLDASDGWAAWSLWGDSMEAAFSHLSRLRLPDEGFFQGDVAGVPTKVIRYPRRLHLLVPAMWRDYLRDRILERCRSLGVRERTPDSAAMAFVPPEVSR